MAVRGSPTEAIRAQIHQLVAGGEQLLSVVKQLARLPVRPSARPAAGSR